ncbi:MAG: hypothetical protein KDA47_07005, partial [Planctomycetales bacterium]|nr:hypothetical protein [Planctomycetales bacterium]
MAADLVRQNADGERLTWDAGSGDWSFAGGQDVAVVKLAALDALRAGDEDFDPRHFRLVVLEAQAPAPGG